MAATPLSVSLRAAVATKCNLSPYRNLNEWEWRNNWLQCKVLWVKSDIYTSIIIIYTKKIIIFDENRTTKKIIMFNGNRTTLIHRRLRLWHKQTANKSLLQNLQYSLTSQN